jgi:hypothetical protein
MLYKIISLFLLIQLTSFAVWQGVQAWSNKPTANSPILVTSQDVMDKEGVKASAQTPVQPFSHVRFAARTEEKRYQDIDSNKKREIATALEKLPSKHISTLRNLVLDYDPEAHRGLGGKSIIILRAVNMEPTEFFGVMIHEIGHNVDLGYLSEADKKNVSEFKDGKRPVYEGDPSLNFYRISWDDDKTRKKTAGNMDFVSGYGLTDPFEDFAECYVYYVLHNKEFKSKTQTSEQLLQKYNYMKNTVFQGWEYDTGTYIKDGLKRRPWDITVLSYDLENFLTS